MKILINELRTAKGLSLDKVAEATGVPKPTLWALENGERVQVRLEHLDALMEFFQVGPNDRIVEEAIDLPLQPNPVLQERAKKVSAGRWGE